MVAIFYLLPTFQAICPLRIKFKPGAIAAQECAVAICSQLRQAAPSLPRQAGFQLEFCAKGITPRSMCGCKVRPCLEKVRPCLVVQEQGVWGAAAPQQRGLGGGSPH